MDIIANRAAMSPKVEEAVRDAIGEDYFIEVTAVVLTNIDFSDAFEQAVEEKMIAEQKQLKADYDNETKIAKAEANAKAKIVAAEAEKKANELLERSITDKILEKAWIDKWDGKLPQVVTGDETGIMIPSLGE
jgi:regulator of protease activity HflC (stomatin/prohibitin superfamily)